MKLPSDVRRYLAENRVEAVRFNDGIFYSINDDIPELDKPAEPLIKDEKIRKAVRVWAEVTGTTRVNVWAGTIESRQNDARIYFDLNMLIDDGDDYTIVELCGEEEE